MTNPSPLWRLLAAIALLGIASVPVAGQTLPADMARFPNFAADISRPARIAVASGLWASSATWGGIVPTGADVVMIPSGVTVTIGAPAVAQAYSTVVNGTLSVNSLFVVVNLVVNPIGTLTASPGAIIRIPDVPFDFRFDPQQFGHGLVGLGTLRLLGTSKTAFVDLAVPPVAGSTQLVLNDRVTNWQVGDVLVLDDSRVVYDNAWTFFPDGEPDGTALPRRMVDETERVTIASLSGTTVQLATPLRYAHPGARDETGALSLLPQVGNLTRDVVIESANPLGVRGHTMFTARADVDIENVAFRNLGRTRATTLNSTVFDSGGAATSIGTNQIGRYAVHFHHLVGPLPSARANQSRFVGDVIDGSPKIGLAVHDSHFGLYQDLVIVDAIGAGLFLEQGNETGNTFDRVFVVNAPGSNYTREDGTNFANLGTDLWVSSDSGSNNTFTNLVLAGSRQAAAWFQSVDGPATLPCPVGPGIDPRDQSVPCQPATQALLAFKGVRLVSHFHGLRLPKPIDARIDDLTAWNIAQQWVLNFPNGGTSITLTNPKIYPGSSGMYVTAINVQAQHFTATNLISFGASAGGVIADQPGMSPTLGGVSFDLRDCFIQGGATAVIHNLDWERYTPSENTPTTVNISNCRLIGNRRIDVSASYQDNLNATVPYVFTITDWQKVVGSNFRLYPEAAAPTAIMPNTGNFVVPGWRTFANMIGAPVAGLTNAASMAKYGLAFLGAMAPCSVQAKAVTGVFACGTILPEPEPPPITPPSHTPPPPSTPAPTATWTLAASDFVIAAGQSVTLTITTTSTDFHNVFINGVQPTSWKCTTGCVGTLRVTPRHTTTYQAEATTKVGGRYPSVITTVTVNGP